ncbi:hypothetical protein [Halotia branconii]|uniref:Uncharacterized protein n=1 Tax=Halotia branconii CENA392 TaxID=1539056 RepID=A0AAJ6NVN6_9CYAN|nr:hypothetical protein [Halotia branconii]WGV27595.1 hypothetical protein QI031_08965 [Halotia branconii CENA392]
MKLDDILIKINQTSLNFNETISTELIVPTYKGMKFSGMGKKRQRFDLLRVRPSLREAAPTAALRLNSATNAQDKLNNGAKVQRNRGKKRNWGQGKLENWQRNVCLSTLAPLLFPVPNA